MSEEERRGIQQTLRGGQDGIDDGLTPAERRAQLTAHQRELRTDYRAIIEESAANQKNIATLTSAELAAMVIKQDKLFARVSRPQEAALDSKAFKHTATAVTMKARQMKVDQNAFDVDEFIGRLKRTLGSGRKRARADDEMDENDEEENGFGDWEKLGWMGVKHSRRVCLPDFLLGPLQVEQKQRVIQRRAKLDKSQFQKTQPTEIRKEDTKVADDNDTVKMSLSIEDKLQEACTTESGEAEPINFYEFVINPFSFAQTIENLFYLSFALRRGTASLEANPDTEVLELLSSQPADQEQIEQEAGAGTMYQLVLEMDVETWQDAIETFDIKDCRYIANRGAPAPQPNVAQWY